MLTPSDKELDRLSREAAEQYEPDENISSWEKLEARLDADMGKTPSVPTRRFGRGPVGYSALILLLTGASYFLLKHENGIRSNTTPGQINNESVTKSKQPRPGKSESNPSGTDERETKSSPLPNPSSPQDAGNGALPDAGAKSAADKQQVMKPGVDPANTDANNKPLNPGNGGRDKSSAQGAHAGTGVVVTTAAASTGLPPGHSAATGKGQTKNTNSTNTNKSPAGTGLLVANEGINTGSQGSSTKTALDQQEAQLKTATLPGIGHAGNRHGLPEDVRVNSFSSADLATPSSGAISDRSEHKYLHLNRPLSIGVMFAPDITSVRGLAPEKLSTNFGLTLGYQLTSRLSINTGFIATKKYYSADGKDFHGWQSPGSYYLDFVNGNCNMYEIPLTLRYDFDGGKKTNFFINGGFSTYLMTQESYVYHLHYNSMSGPRSYAFDSSYTSHENYPFSVISLSAGVEHRIGKSLSLQVEPFVKIPLTGMGIGNLSLSSYGLSFSLRFAPLLGRSRR